MIINNKFKTDLKKLIGLKCFDAGFSLGTILILDIGKKLEPKDENKRILSNGKRFIKGEYSIRIINFWRIIHNKNIYCSYSCSEEKNDYSILSEKMKAIENKEITKIIWNKNTFDLKIIFEENYTLELVCYGNTFNSSPSNVYYFSNPDGTFVLLDNYTIEYEEKDPNSFWQYQYIDEV